MEVNKVSRFLWLVGITILVVAILIPRNRSKPKEESPASVVERPSLFPPTQVKTLTPAEAREKYAIDMALSLRHDGVEATVGAAGKEKDTLEIWMPMTRESVKQILEMEGMQSEVPRLGFTKLVLHDRFEGNTISTWKFHWIANAGWAQ
jgi:hypothetical protein